MLKHSVVLKCKANSTMFSLVDLSVIFDFSGRVACVLLTTVRKASMEKLQLDTYVPVSEHD